MHDLPLTFNMVFVPGTVRYLQYSPLSLVKYSPYRYRLVANGLEHRELCELQSLAASHSQLEFFPYPTKVPLPHGTILNVLQQREASPYFCFLDSDVFACDSFCDQLEESIQRSDVVSSCYPLGVAPGDIQAGYSGMCQQTPEGVPLASSFFAVYRNEVIHDVITKTGIGFERWRPTEWIPPVPRDSIPDDALGVSLLDTGKLLNMISSEFNLRYEYSELPQLVHVGGLSSIVTKFRWLSMVQNRIHRALRRPYILTDRDLNPGNISLNPFASSRVKKLSRVTDEHDFLSLKRVILRSRIAIYFQHFLESLLDGRTKPRLDLSDHQLADRVHQVSAVLQHLYCRDEPAGRIAA